MKQTKKSKIEALRTILYAYPAGVEVTKIEDVDHLMNTFINHPHWKLKQGVGIKRILVNTTGYRHENRCFYIERLDNSRTDISFMQCINGASTPISDVRAACRSAIHPLIIAFREKNVVFGETLCPITNEVLTKANTHIDHYELPFHQVFKKWIDGQQVDWLFTQLNSTERDMETEIYFKNPIIIADFLDFHDAHTHLRAVSKVANLSLLRRR